MIQNGKSCLEIVHDAMLLKNDMQDFLGIKDFKEIIKGLLKS
jgi:hypothetical protein